MASDTPKSSGWGLWSLVETVTTTVKQKSDEIINIYREDLQEFGKTIVTDTSAVIKDRVDKLSDSKTTISSTTHLQTRFLRVQRDSKTYTEEPADTAEYEAWANTFNVGAPENTEAITQLLTSNEAVRDFHTSLVPSKVAYRDFWCRYYYKIHKIEEEEQRRAAILKNANANDDEEFSWDVEEEANNNNNNNNNNNVSKVIASPPEASPHKPLETETETITSAKEPEPEHQPAPTKAEDPAPQSTVPAEAEKKPEKEQEPKQETEPQQEQEDKEETSSAEETSDDIDEEIARKFESQKLEPKSDQKSDPEDGWADWE